MTEQGVLGIYEVDPKNFFLELIPDRKGQTLYPFILRVVRPDTFIFTDSG